MLLKTKIVGVLNLSPDSFSDGRIYTKSQLQERVAYLINAGVDIIDVGAESTAPGSQAVSLEEELRRLEDFFSIRKEFKIPFSLDTTKAQVAEKGIRHGVKIINDVSGGRADPAMFEVIAKHPRVKYVMMYCKNPSGRADRELRAGGEIMQIIKNFFDQSLESAMRHGIKRSQITIDPGMGAFVSPDAKDSIHILQHIKALKKLYKLPVWIGTSRKGFLAKIVPDNGPQDRVGSSLASTIYAICQGAKFVRVHDVKELKQFIQVWNTLDTISG